jgi:putative ABC transport system permease protein
MSLSDLVWLYRARLRARAMPAREALAAVGIAVGVALVFSSQISSASLTGSFRGLVNEIVGGAHRLQLQSRGPEGFDQQTLARVQALPGVKVALPLLEAQATVKGPHGQASVLLIGADPRFARAGGRLLRRYSAKQLASQEAVALPAPLARSIGVGSLETFAIGAGPRLQQTLLATTFGESDIGGLVHSPIAITNVSYAQRLVGLRGRLTRIFVEPKPGARAEVKAGLERIAPGAQANVYPAGHDATLFEVAAQPATQSEGLFSAISALVAFLFALNAMLITAPARRALIAELRPQGATRLMALEVVLFDAAVLGVAGCALGLVLGDLLSLAVFSGPPNYLSFAFPVGAQRTITVQSVLIAVGSGLAATLIGVLWPLREVLRGAFADGEPARERAGRTQVALGVLGLVLLGATTAILFAAPRYAVIGSVALVGALLCLLPHIFDGVVSLFDEVQTRLGWGAAPVLAVTELQAPGTRVRSLAIAAIAAIAVFGIVEFGGAQANLQHGLDESARNIDANGQVWVTVAGEGNTFATVPFRLQDARLGSLPGVAEVAVYRGGFLNWRNRRVWIVAPPATASQPVPASQLRAGGLDTAEARVNAGGWATLSEALAAEHHLRVGQSFLLPSPHPTVVRLAGITSNLAWPAGAMVMSANTYAQAWAPATATAYQVRPAPGVSPPAAAATVRAALASAQNLQVETLAQREAMHRARSRKGLARLTQIRLLVLIAAILAVAGAMAAILWQRRDIIAYIKCEGYRRGVLWRWLLLENALLIGTGAAAGAIFGLYGEVLATHFTATVTGFPVVYGVGLVGAVASFALVSAAAAAIVALPGYLVSRTPPRTVKPAY